MSSKREKISGARAVASDYQSEKSINMHGPSVEQPQITASLVGHSARRAFLGSCVAHVLHDGYTDLIYVMLPIWQTQFGIGYAWLAVIRALYLGSPAGFQVPANRLAKRFGDKTILVSGTALAAIGYGLAGLSGSILGLGGGAELSRRVLKQSASNRLRNCVPPLWVFRSGPVRGLQFRR